MKKDEEKTKVIFRKAYYRGTKEEEILAFFPGAPANPGRIACYAFVGQHGESDIEFFWHSTKKCAPKEYAVMKDELEKCFGYNLKVVQRLTRKDRLEAWNWRQKAVVQSGAEREGGGVMGAEAGKVGSMWVLAVTYVFYEDMFHRGLPGVEVMAMGSYRDCLDVLRESVEEEVSDYWGGPDAEQDELAGYVKGIMASRKEYGACIREWTASWETRAIVWRLQKRKCETKKRRIKC